MPLVASGAAGRFAEVGVVPCAVGASSVYEHGWQSWSPAGLYPAAATSPRPRVAGAQTCGFRPSRPAPTRGFQGEGLLVVVPEEGPVHMWSAPDPWHEVASIRAHAIDGAVVVSADAPVLETSAGDLGSALHDVATRLAEQGGLGQVGSLGPGWCSWYCYGMAVTEADVLGNLAAMDRLDLPIEVVLVDDGHQAAIGDWLQRSPGFGPLDRLAERIRDTGRRAGVWTAPFLVSPDSALAIEHPDWLVPEEVALHNWGQDMRILDVTSPAAAEHLSAVYRWLAAAGFRFHKIDFLYAGAMDGRRVADCSGLDAYALGLELIRDALGSDATILGCGAPLLPSIGRVDAMRVSPDTGPHYEPADGDLSQPGQRSAIAATAARGWMHARLWVNDPDCILVRAEVEARERWAAHLDATSGLMVSSDPFDALDARGLQLTRALLRPSSPGR